MVADKLPVEIVKSGALRAEKGKNEHRAEKANADICGCHLVQPIRQHPMKESCVSTKIRKSCHRCKCQQKVSSTQVSTDIFVVNI